MEIKENFLVVANDCNIRLRTIEKSDIEALRKWKNDNRERFFYQQHISKQEQSKWFANYLTKCDDYIFLVEEQENPFSPHKIGCLGFRILNNKKVDIYNVIRGNESLYGATMKDAFLLMLKYIKNKYEGYEIYCEVLKDNPAIEWYSQCGFLKTKNCSNFYILRFDKIIEKVNIRVEENRND